MYVRANAPHRSDLRVVAVTTKQAVFPWELKIRKKYKAHKKANY